MLGLQWYLGHHLLPHHPPTSRGRTSCRRSSATGEAFRLRSRSRKVRRRERIAHSGRGQSGPCRKLESKEKQDLPSHYLIIWCESVKIIINWHLWTTWPCMEGPPPPHDLVKYHNKHKITSDKNTGYSICHSQNMFLPVILVKLLT